MEGNLIPTGAELAESERRKSESERLRANAAERKACKALNIAEAERLRAETAEKKAEESLRSAESERLRAEKLAEKLRLLGIDPE